MPCPHNREQYRSNTIFLPYILLHTFSAWISLKKATVHLWLSILSYRVVYFRLVNAMPVFFSREVPRRCLAIIFLMLQMYSSIVTIFSLLQMWYLHRVWKFLPVPLYLVRDRHLIVRMLLFPLLFHIWLWSKFWVCCIAYFCNYLWELFAIPCQWISLFISCDIGKRWHPLHDDSFIQESRGCWRKHEFKVKAVGWNWMKTRDLINNC